MGCQRLGSRQLVAQRRVASVFSRLYHGMRGGVVAWQGQVRTGVMDTRGGGSHSHINYTRDGSTSLLQCHPSTRSSTCGSPTTFFFSIPRDVSVSFRFQPSLALLSPSFFASSILRLLSPRCYSSLVSASFFSLLLLFLCSIPPLLYRLFQPGPSEQEASPSSSNLLPLAFSFTLFLSLFLAHSSPSPFASRIRLRFDRVSRAFHFPPEIPLSPPFLSPTSYYYPSSRDLHTGLVSPFGRRRYRAIRERDVSIVSSIRCPIIRKQDDSTSVERSFDSFLLFFSRSFHILELLASAISILLVFVLSHFLHRANRWQSSRSARN